MDFPGSVHRVGAGFQGPGPAFVFADCEKANLTHAVINGPQHRSLRRAGQAQVLHEHLAVVDGQFVQLQLQLGRRLARVERELEQVGG